MRGETEVRLCGGTKKESIQLARAFLKSREFTEV